MSEAVRRRPYSVVLFDEIEKAHHDVFNVLLQVLDDGRLTDGQGRTVDFKNTIVIMTSNIGSPIIQEFYGGGSGSVKDEAELEHVVKMELKANFRPEFLNRVDDIIIFHSLSQAQIGEIVEVQLRTVIRRLADQKVTLELTPEARRLIAKEGYDPQFGARPLKRVIQDLLLNPLATKLLNGEIKPGARVTASANKTGLLLTSEPGAQGMAGATN